MNTYLIVGVTIVVLIIIVIAMVKMEKFTSSDPKVIHPIIMSQAPTTVQVANTKINNVVEIFESDLGRNDKTVTTALQLLSQLEEQYGIPAGDYYTGNYTGLWSCNTDGSSAVWTFNKVSNVVATTFPTTNNVVVKLPSDLTNTYWTCYPNHAIGVPTLAQLQTFPTIAMSVYENECWKKL